ncbi:Hsp70 family chaperone [Colletotrichum plurivorum]|uniref:Hsp70 family chaperone n=1 Tax=Colletotrichum plurivorum TaxID=2175906 RepID=A0A8H6KQ58_9PEZI|nr:Hsp70 family chaperone [Colletotrichum plurivorum]
MVTKRGDGHEESTIVIGIDFGTTFSGVSWAFSGQPNDIEIITRWKAQLRFNSDTEKTPSTLLYQGNHGDAVWGYGIPASNGHEPLKWFKLLLIDANDLPRELRASPQIATARKILSDNNKNAIEVVSDYLKNLWDHSIESIKLTAGKKLVELCKFHVVITLPAIWPAYAKARMRRAAQKAGILDTRWAGQTTLSFISEPEAAALATMRDLGKRPDIEAGDHFVVCDAGGGTVDLISYEIVGTSPLVVREAVKGDGALCGGVFLDEEFIKLMKRKVNERNWNSLPAEEVKKMLNGDWEHGIKQQYEGQEQEWPVELPVTRQKVDTSRRGLVKKQTLVLTNADLKPVFERVTRQVISLVEEQINGVRFKTGQTPKYVMLVGGFGRCQYLGIRLQAAIGDHIELLQSQGPKPWTAISRGAVVHGLTSRSLGPGLSVAVSSRISRLSYGILMNTVFDETRHLLADKYWCVLREQYRTNNQTDWYINLGAEVSAQRPLRKPYHRVFTHAPEEITEILYYSGMLPAPTRGDETVKDFCTITWTKKIDIHSLPKSTSKAGVTYYTLHFEIEMICDGNSLDFTIIYDGQPVGSHNVSVDFEPQGGQAGCILKGY